MNEYLSVKLKVISFFSMVMVVFLHSYNLVVNLNSGTVLLNQGYSTFVQNFISQGIARVAVPLFFSISGYLFFLNGRGELKEFILKFNKRLKTIVIPYLFWSIFCLLLFLIMQSIPQLAVFFTNKHIVDYTVSEFISTVFINPIPYQLWFLRDLMILVVLSPFLFYLIKKFSYFILVVFMAAWFLDFDFMCFSNESLLFYVFGATISILKKDILEIKFLKKQLIYTIIWIVILLFRNTLVQYNYDNSYLLLMLHKISVLIGIVAIWSLYDILVKNRDLSKSSLYAFSHYSFFIFVFHEPILSFLKKILFYVTNKNELMSLLIYIIAPLITIIMSLLIGHCLKRFVPKFYSIISGGR